MTRQAQSDRAAWLVASLVGGTALVGGVLWTLAVGPRAPRRPEALPSDDWQTHPTFTEADVEAAARMLASENPRGSQALHIEQIWTQLRARKPGQSLFDRIAAGSGWGPQGARTLPGSLRPVSTDKPASDAHRQLAREVLAGLHASTLPGARKFFEPAEQDRAFVLAERARNKRAAGQALTPQETRLLGYRRTAAEIRRKWRSEGSQYLGSVGDVEFFT